MKSLTARKYALGIYRQVRVDQSRMRKLQTVGADRDWGTNEILMSSEKHGAIVDRSGDLVDLSGLDHQEPIRLAKKRLLISEFNISPLSRDGGRVLTADTKVTPS